MHPGVSHGTKAAQGVGHHHGAGLEVALGPGGDLLAAKPTDTAQAHSHRPALAIEFDRGDERRLARRASPGFPPAALPAPIRIIELHPTAQRARVIALLHHLHQLVLDLPRGGCSSPPVAATAPAPKSRSSSASAGTSPRTTCEGAASCSPGSCPRSARLAPAAAALIQRPALMAPVPGMLTSGANEPVRPTPTKHRLGALLLRPVLVHELRQAVAF